MTINKGRKIISLVSLFILQIHFPLVLIAEPSSLQIIEQRIKNEYQQNIQFYRGKVTELGKIAAKKIVNKAKDSAAGLVKVMSAISGIGAFAGPVGDSLVQGGVGIMLSIISGQDPFIDPNLEHFKEVNSSINDVKESIKNLNDHMDNQFAANREHIDKSFQIAELNNAQDLLDSAFDHLSTYNSYKQSGILRVVNLDNAFDNITKAKPKFLRLRSLGANGYALSIALQMTIKQEIMYYVRHLEEANVAKVDVLSNQYSARSLRASKEKSKLFIDEENFHYLNNKLYWGDIGSYSSGKLSKETALENKSTIDSLKVSKVGQPDSNDILNLAEEGLLALGKIGTEDYFLRIKEKEAQSKNPASSSYMQCFDSGLCSWMGNSTFKDNLDIRFPWLVKAWWKHEMCHLTRGDGGDIRTAINRCEDIKPAIIEGLTIISANELIQSLRDISEEWSQLVPKCRGRIEYKGSAPSLGHNLGNVKNDDLDSWFFATQKQPWNSNITNPSGFFSFGPYMPLPEAGNYILQVLYSYTTDDISFAAIKPKILGKEVWEESGDFPIFDLVINGVGPLQVGTLPSTGNTPATLVREFSVDSSNVGKTFEFRIFYKGNGALTLNKIIITKKECGF